jgi:hypothetical protein
MVRYVSFFFFRFANDQYKFKRQIFNGKIYVSLLSSKKCKKKNKTRKKKEIKKKKVDRFRVRFEKKKIVA